MHIAKVSIKNFRLLSDVTLSLEQSTTTIVGRNNSGKTSLTELFRRVLSDKTPHFRFEDFSQSAHDAFWKAYCLKQAGAEPSIVRAALPAIEVRLVISYDPVTPDLGTLSEIIINLDDDCNEALLLFTYQLKDGVLDDFFEAIAVEPSVPEDKQCAALCRLIRDHMEVYYIASTVAVDPRDETNTKTIDWSQMRSLVHAGFISAQRGLDDLTYKDSDVLGKILSALFENASSNSADADSQLIAEALTVAVKDIQADIDNKFSTHLTSLLPTFAMFGYPGLKDPGLTTETILDVKRLLVDHTRVSYAGPNGINLPESYNGLGARNLIFILLKLLEFYRIFVGQPTTPAMHVIFIEEPEVHLHPQMQEVFITQLNQIAKTFADTFNGGITWPVQFIVTTHSSHVANRASFDSIRYFFAKARVAGDERYSTIIKDLTTDLAGASSADRTFLHKYMTLTRCDLLFADKAILIEGSTERLLLPAMFTRLDAASTPDKQLARLYLSVVEVGGAYAHIFYPLLEFLELPALIITDMDSVDSAANNEACLVSQGTHTSNACIKEWFGDATIAPGALIAQSEASKVNGLRRIAFQIPEAQDGPCGRSFEEAFVLANEVLFGLDKVSFAERELEASKRAKRVTKKTDFALQYAIEQSDWNVPRYIKEGLTWLVMAGSSPAVSAPIANPAPVATESAPQSDA